MYLLSFDNDETAGLASRWQNDGPERVNICVHRCEDFGYNYVSNPSTRKCEYCGKNCLHCSLQYGCTKCERGHEFSTAASDVSHLNSANTPAFPFSYNPLTKYGGPSSQFATCVECSGQDPRCDNCQNTTAMVQMEVETLDENGEEVVLIEDQLQHMCASCHEYVQTKEQ